VGGVLTSGDGWNDRNRLSVSHRSAEALEKPDVLVGDEDVDEPSEVSVLLEEPVREPGMGLIEGIEHLADRGAFELELSSPPRKRPELARDPDYGAHRLNSLVWLLISSLIRWSRSSAQFGAVT
jgi:hypothetical protein